MLASYFDDSVDGDFFVVGGFVSPVGRWESFSDDWETVLHQKPRIEYYKSHEANQSPDERADNNQFRGFSRGMITQKEKTLAEVIRAHAEYAVYSPLERELFNTIVRPRVLRPKRGEGRYAGHEYHFPFHGCIAATVRYLEDHNVKDKVDFFFDEQGKVGKWARDSFESMKTGTYPIPSGNVYVRPYLGVCVHHNDKEVVALQAADMFASRARKFHNKDAAADPVIAILALDPIPCLRFNWRREMMEEMMNTWFPVDLDCGT